MVNTDYMVARHIIPLMVKSYNDEKSSYETITDIRNILGKREIRDNFDMVVRDIDDTYSAIVFTFNETKSIDDIVLSAIVVNHTRHTAHYYVLRHTVEYVAIEGRSTFDFVIKNCLYGISELEMNNEYGRESTLYVPNKEVFVAKAVGYAKKEESCKTEIEDEDYAKKHKDGMEILEDHFAWGSLIEKIDKINELFD